jgi:hypothetical protein
VGQMSRYVWQVVLNPCRASEWLVQYRRRKYPHLRYYSNHKTNTQVKPSGFRPLINQVEVVIGLIDVDVGSKSGILREVLDLTFDLKVEFFVTQGAEWN